MAAGKISCSLLSHQLSGLAIEGVTDCLQIQAKIDEYFQYFHFAVDYLEHKNASLISSALQSLHQSSLQITIGKVLPLMRWIFLFNV